MTAARNFLSCLALSTAIVGALASPAAAVPVTVALSDAAVPEGNGDFNNFYPAVLNDFGQVAFRAFLKNTSGGTADDGGVYLFNGSALENLARENAAVPEGNGDYNGFDNPVLNNSGQVAFEASLKNTSGSTLDNSGIYLFNGSALENLAREDAAVPEGNGNFNVFQNPVLNDSGQVAFRATLKNTSGGTADDSGIYLFNGTALENLARENAAAPDGNGDFKSFANPILNDSGQVAFRAFFKNTSGGIADDSGIYLADGIEQLRVVREGDVLAGKTVSTATLAVDYGSLAGHGSGLNDLGQVAYMAFFSGGGSGIFLFTPELHFRGTAADSQWDSKTNWTLSIDPAFVHTVHVDPSVATTIDGPATATTVSGLNVNTAGVGTTTLDLKPGAPLTVSGLTTVGTNGRIAGNGTLIATGGVNNAGEIDLGTSSMLVMGGTISNTGVVRGNGQINNPIDNLNGGEFRVAAGQRQEWTSTSAHNNAGRIEVIGNLTLPGGVAELEIDAAVVNAASTGLITGRDAALRFQGGLTNEGSIGLSFGISDIFGDIDNTGIISVGGGGQATFYDDLTQNGTLNIAATGGSVSSVVVFGEFSGSGGFTGGGDLSQLGDLRIGNSPASVTMGGNLHLGASTNTEIELAGLGVGDFDQALISGDLSLAGSLSVSALGGFTPGFGQEFLIFDVMGTRTGQFFGLGEGDLVGDFGGTELFVSYLGGDGNDVMLYAASAPVPEPSTYALGAIGLLGLGLYGWRRKRSSPVN